MPVRRLGDDPEETALTFALFGGGYLIVEGDHDTDEDIPDADWWWEGLDPDWPFYPD